MQSILLLGDSLTQRGYESHWVSLLSHYYIRRADVLNRGLSGYNSKWVLTILRDASRRDVLLPPALRAQPPLFATLLLGSNDMSSEYQFVALDDFRRNMRDIIACVHAAVRPRCGIFVFTPPPVDEEAWAAFQQRGRNRTCAAALAYRDAVVEVVRALQHEQQHRDEAERVELMLVDLHYAVLRYGRKARTTSDNTTTNNNADNDGGGGDAEDEAELRAMTYDRHAPWTQLFSDGLHFNAEGGALMYRELLRAMTRSRHAAQLLPESLPYVLPDVTVSDTITDV